MRNELVYSLLIISLIFILGCSKKHDLPVTYDPRQDPSLSVGYNGDTVAPIAGRPFIFPLEGNSNTETKASLRSLEMQVVLNGNLILQWDTLFSGDISTFKFNYIYKLPAPVQPGDYLGFTFSLTDKASHKSNRDVRLPLDWSAAVATYKGINLYVINNGDTANRNAFGYYSAKWNKTFSYNSLIADTTLRSDVDFAYNGKHLLIAIKDNPSLKYNWYLKHQVVFHETRLTNSNFDTAAYYSIINYGKEITPDFLRNPVIQFTCYPDGPSGIIRARRLDMGHTPASFGTFDIKVVK